MLEDRITGYSDVIKDDMKKKEEEKAINAKSKPYAIRMTKAEYSMFKNACADHKIKPAVFAQEAIMLAVYDLVNQRKLQNQCMLEA
jgi:hypothetical protein